MCVVTLGNEDLEFVLGARFSAHDIDFLGDLYALDRNVRERIFLAIKDRQETEGEAEFEGQKVKWDLNHFDDILRPFEPYSDPERNVRARRLVIDQV